MDADFRSVLESVCGVEELQCEVKDWRPSVVVKDPVTSWARWSRSHPIGNRERTMATWPGGASPSQVSPKAFAPRS